MMISFAFDALKLFLFSAKIVLYLCLVEGIWHILSLTFLELINDLKSLKLHTIYKYDHSYWGINKRGHTGYWQKQIVPIKFLEHND